MNLKYRSDIDGLRFFAVFSVLIFHINKTILPGGFTGVDIFFVISGFLITSILIKEIDETERINISEFYRRRIKRILPSFFLVAGVTTFFAYIFLLPDDLASYGKSLKSCLAFISNHYFGRQKDYFAPESDELPLLHTWSLSVEEQFYFIWPLMLFGILKLKSKKFVMASVILLIAASTLLAQVWSDSPEYALESYFYLVTRMGELLLGCLTAIFIAKTGFKLEKKSSFILATMGLIAIVTSFFILDEDSHFPGLWSLLPCGGTALIILVGHFSNTPIFKLLSWKPLAWIGLHSYALYLWHWPVLAFYRYFAGQTTLNFKQGILVLAITIALSWLSRTFLEQPLNRSKKSFKFIAVSFWALPSIILLIISLSFIKTQGLPERIANVDQRNFLLETQKPFTTCHSSNKTNCWSDKNSSAPKILLLGDSHAGHLAGYFRKIFPDFNIYAKTSGACPPVLRGSRKLIVSMKSQKTYPDSTCLNTIEVVSKTFEKETFSAVFISARWSLYEKNAYVRKEFIKTLRYIKSKNIPVYFFDQVPTFKLKDFIQLVRNTYSPGDKWLPQLERDLTPYKEVHTFNKIAESENIPVIEPIDDEVQKRIDLPIYANRFVYRDGSHLNHFGSQLMGQEMTSKIRKIVKIQPVATQNIEN